MPFSPTPDRLPGPDPLLPDLQRGRGDLGALRDLLVVLDGSSGSEERLKVAISLAQQHRAYLIGFCTPDLLPLRNWARRADELERLKEWFTDLLQYKGVKGEWQEASGKAAGSLLAHARLADLVILGQADPEHPPRSGGRHIAEDVLLRSGRPVLVIPYIGRFETVATRVLIGWNGSREAARAIHDTLPLIANARFVTILTVRHKDSASGPEHAMADKLAAHLARHGINATIAAPVVNISTSDALLSYSGDISADLLVVDGFGHSRVREAVFGGLTREILRHMPIPMLISH
jgi:nucleotide-binding universal stress UspA family protein